MLHSASARGKNLILIHIGNDKENELSEKSIIDTLVKSKEGSSIPNSAYPEYLESIISPHKSCRTCAKINNFIHKVKDKKPTINEELK